MMMMMSSLSSLLFLCVVDGPAWALPMGSPCQANGSLYYVGEWYNPGPDPCAQCECTSRGPSCTLSPCPPLPPTCTHLTHYPTDCCPRCESVGCEYHGDLYRLGQDFQPSECEQCTCDMDGIARCLVADCAPPPCINPVYEKGQCCPECKDGPNCYSDSSQVRVIAGGAAVWIDKCTHCRCHAGQDVGYWEGNRVAECVRIPDCTASHGRSQSPR